MRIKISSTATWPIPPGSPAYAPPSKYSAKKLHKRETPPEEAASKRRLEVEVWSEAIGLTPVGVGGACRCLEKGETGVSEDGENGKGRATSLSHSRYAHLQAIVMPDNMKPLMQPIPRSDNPTFTPLIGDDAWYTGHSALKNPQPKFFHNLWKSCGSALG